MIDLGGYMTYNDCYDYYDLELNYVRACLKPLCHERLSRFRSGSAETKLDGSFGANLPQSILV